MARRLELARLLDRAPSRERDLCLAMICQRALGRARSWRRSARSAQSTLGRRARRRGRRRGRALRGAGLAAGAPGADRGARSRAATWPTASWCSTTSPRRYFEGRTLPAGQARLLARRQARHAADRLRAALRPARPAGRGRGVQRRAARRQDAARPDRASSRRASALSDVIVVCDRGMVTKANLELLRRQRRGRLDHRAQGAADQEARSRPARCSCRCLTRPTWPRSARRGLPRRAAGRLPQPARRRRARAQTRRAAGRDRARARRDRRARRARHARRRRPDRARRRPGAQALPR